MALRLPVRVVSLVLCLAAVPSASANVILVTLDGVRWRELFEGPDPALAAGDKRPVMPFLRRRGAGVRLYGDVRHGVTATISNGPVMSLPAYQSIFAGWEQDCESNRCGRIRVPTMAERLRRELGLRHTDVATIASWGQISRAVESVRGATFVSTGLAPVEDGRRDRLLRRLNAAQERDQPDWMNARYDRYTFAHAVRYLRVHRPRFLYIALNDADEWGHRGDYRRYLATLRQYDAWVRSLVRTLESLGRYGRGTTLIVTTDHGRGNGAEWREHGGNEDARRIFVWVRSPSDLPAPAPGLAVTHLDLRPTIEALLGLPACAECRVGLAVGDKGRTPGGRSTAR